MAADLAPATPAATLILLREREGGAEPEVLMLERAAHLFFAAGAWVFPGGRVDAGDHVVAALTDHAGDPDDLAARVAAIRETIEEAGIAVAIDPAPDAALTATLRAGLLGGIPFATLMAEHGLRPDLDAVVPFARWRPETARRVFDTRFYVAAAPSGAVGEADGGETVRALWTTAADVPIGANRIFFPTLSNLQRVAALGSVAAVRATLKEFPVAKITPWQEVRDGETWHCIPDCHGYPVTAVRTRDVQNR
jgi:8-oxo-dGTP pyrophosphatase MutT (NUDIX family)